MALVMALPHLLDDLRRECLEIARIARGDQAAGNAQPHHENEGFIKLLLRPLAANVTVVVWRDDGYGLIDWKQRTEFGRPFGVEFSNPDLVAFAESFGMAAFRPETAADLYPTLTRALDHDGLSLVDVPIDYRENLRLTERLGAIAAGW